MVATSLKHLCQIYFHCVEIVLLVKPVILECFNAFFHTGNDWILKIQPVNVSPRFSQWVDGKKQLRGKKDSI